MGYALAADGYLTRDGSEVRVWCERGLSVSEADRARYPDQSIFLDGVFAGPPFIDNVRRQYALDHHRGCVRQFTLASCEQAAVMVAMGLPLDQGVWAVYLNEPDLDALLAAWVLCNRDRLVEHDEALLAEVMPLLRVEGNIDIHGYEQPALSGVLPRSYAIHRERLDRLRARENRLCAARRWQNIDPLRYAHEQLGAIDRELLGTGRRGAAGRHASRRVGVRGRRLAVLWRSALGIYEVEEALKLRYGDALALIVLDRGQGRVTLLQTDPFLPRTLTDLYPVLDAADPNADPLNGNVWGGADDIGGSPRKTGTGLSGDQVLRLVARLYALEEAYGGAPSERTSA